MRLYRLTPIKMDDPSWEASSIKEAVWVWATLPDSARDKVAHATLVAMKPRARFAPIFASPWRLYAVTSCEPDPCRTDVPLDKPIIADGRPLGLYPWSLVCKVYYRHSAACRQSRGAASCAAARAASGHDAAPPSSVMNSRRLMGLSPPVRPRAG